MNVILLILKIKQVEIHVCYYSGNDGYSKRQINALERPSDICLHYVWVRINVTQALEEKVMGNTIVIGKLQAMINEIHAYDK